MPQFLVAPDDVSEPDREAWVRGDEAHHLLRVCRARPGDRVAVFDGAGRRWEGTLAEARGEEARIAGLAALAANEPAVELWLLQAFVKGERWEWLLAKATELGVCRVLPLWTERSVANRSDAKTARWEAVLRGAAKQCERGALPRVDPPRPLRGALEALGPPAPGDVRIVLLERSARRGPDLETVSRVVLAVGPEGGWSPTERELLAGAGFAPVSLGPRILRAETAAMAALTLAQARWGDLGPPRDEPTTTRRPP